MNYPQYILGEEFLLDGRSVVRRVTVPDAVFDLLADFASKCGCELPVTKRIENRLNVLHEFRIVFRSQTDQQLQFVFNKFMRHSYLLNLLKKKRHSK